MLLTEIECAIRFCDEKITYHEKNIANIGGTHQIQVKMWREKKESLKALMEQTIMTISTPPIKQ